MFIRNRGGAFNCGKCYKCVRTAIPLHVLGVWEQALTFPKKGTDHWERVIAEDHVALTEENLRFACEHGGDVKLIAMLRRSLKRRQRTEKLAVMFRKSGLARGLDLARRLQRRSPT